MILQALYEQYHRLQRRGEEGLPRYGYSQEKISYCITLSGDGEVMGVVPLLDTSGKKPLPRSLSVPQPEKRTSGIKPNFLWDKTSYVLGVSASSKRAADEHQAFKQFHDDKLRNETDAGLVALNRFLDRWTPEQFAPPHFSAEMLDTNLVFRLDGERQYLHERPAAQALRARLMVPEEDSTAAPMPCLMTGGVHPAARLHPAIKGVNGAQSSGASIVSFNQDAFNSWGKSQGENAPVSDEAAFAYTTVLNHLLRREAVNRQRLTVGDATVVFWAETDQPEEAEVAEWTFATLTTDAPQTDEQAADKVRHALEVVAKGRPLTDIDPRLKPETRMVVLGLSPNASRLSIRYWLRDSLGMLAEHLRAHAQDLLLEPLPWKTPPTPWRLALCTAPMRDGKAKAEDVSPLLAGDLMRAILTGSRYPQSLLSSLVMRMRADGDVGGLRVALCKAVICRDQRLGGSETSSKEVPVSLDVKVTHPAYLLGRLFAVLESTQRAALGGQVNATIRDRYFGAASATPALVFPLLMRNAQNHLARVRKDKAGLAVNLEKDIREIVDKLPDHFPRSLELKDQGRFAIGYYHQSEVRFKKGAPAEVAEEVEAAVDNN
ncbi:MAG: type I-C CRISPR-associated protein Cas8c/Csd1 [Rubrivivax sp.]